MFCQHEPARGTLSEAFRTHAHAVVTPGTRSPFRPTCLWIEVQLLSWTSPQPQRDEYLQKSNAKATALAIKLVQSERASN